jgi:hypothetical protein
MSMKSDLFRFRMARWPAAFAIVLLASCGGGGYSGSSTTPSSNGGGAGMNSTTAVLTAALNGGQETPPNPSSATGTATVNVDKTAKTFTITVTTTGITGTGAHIHDGMPGVAGPILFPLAESPAGSGKWTTTAALNDAQLQAMLAGNYYANVHSATYPAGEIRGQLTVSTTGY